MRGGRQEQVAVLRAEPVSAQANPTAATLTALYAVPVKKWVRGRVYVANRSGTATAFRISIQLANAADDNKQYLAYDAPIAGNEDLHTEELILDQTDEVNVYATLATLSFTFLGVMEPLP